MIYLIKNERGLYYPNDKFGSWTHNIKNAKKYVNKPAMLKRIVRLMDENPNHPEFSFEIFEMVSKGSTTLSNYHRNKKINIIKKKTRNYGGPF